MADRIPALETQIRLLEARLRRLKGDLAEARKTAEASAQVYETLGPLSSSEKDLKLAIDGGFPDAWRTETLAALAQPVSPEAKQKKHWPLSQEEYRRYGRQMIMREVGLEGQLKLKRSRVLIVGLGGLGCPASAYLAGAGVGTLGLVDGDVVEDSNLHRQILHGTERVGMPKVLSAAEGIKSINPWVSCRTYESHLSAENVMETFLDYDLVIDCSDNPATRYLVSDACVVLGKPLVTASALRTEGQLMVLNYPPRPPGDTTGGPCYRCVFPRPPPADSIVTCGDGGVLGPVVGLMGVLQALEAIKVLTKTDPISKEAADGWAPTEPPSLTIFSAYSAPQFRSIRLRSRRAKCATCSVQATVTAESFTSGSLDYIQFCGAIHSVNLLSTWERMPARDYAAVRNRSADKETKGHVLIDVRERVQFDICHLDGSFNLPFSCLNSWPAPGTPGSESNEDSETQKLHHQLQQLIVRDPDEPVYVICRLGNDSQIAVKKFKELGFDNGGIKWIGDITGGLRAWKKDVDDGFPEY
ncbi:Molybdopterin-synthase sulfurtransferase [Trichodelitschia bisporula]|uniref:Adenylyltransferase and sulfurtransferase uba4 n=1 Tax=Trichodelitschia bisporula TaxID=703511 RepID=A0A6G1I1B0_9PEZI|nr:Molybdopterin-synthase sulfurtransferase [Trichodelitschia bisporula]